MIMVLSGIVYGSALFWILVSSAVAVTGGFIAAIFRKRAADRALEKPVSDKQGGMLRSVSQVEELKQLLAGTGYAYDWQQDVFYSVQNPWQRKMGYCSMYDVSSAALGMVIDCEPFYFNYGGKKWMLELWKGQYGITLGGEIGIYNTTGPDLNIPGVFNGTFYFCAGDAENLSMTYTLLRRDKALFNRAARHWWLTGFRLGEYARPSALVMEASITFKDAAMTEAFLESVRRAGYQESEIKHSGNTVLLIFSKPHSRQPITRHGLISFIAMHSNKRLVKKYRKLTKGLTNIVDILARLRESAPMLYDLVLNLGRRQEVYSQHEVIKPYLRNQDGEDG
jgi:hypothetical protein